MAYRQCSVCEAPLGDVQEIFTWGGDTMYLCDDCSSDVKDYIDSLMDGHLGSSIDREFADEDGQ